MPLSEVELRARDEQVIERVRAGETYQGIGQDYGISRERVRQIAGTATDRPCRGCGKRIERPQQFCPECSTCSSCGKPLTRRGRSLLCSDCKPKKGALGPVTMRSVEVGIYAYFYAQTGYQKKSGFYTAESYKPLRWRHFRTIEEARAFRWETAARKCLACGTEFAPTVEHRVYCSTACARGANAHRRKPRTPRTLLTPEERERRRKESNKWANLTPEQRERHSAMRRERRARWTPEEREQHNADRREARRRQKEDQ